MEQSTGSKDDQLVPMKQKKLKKIKKTKKHKFANKTIMSEQNIEFKQEETNETITTTTTSTITNKHNEYKRTEKTFVNQPLEMPLEQTDTMVLDKTNEFITNIPDQFNTVPICHAINPQHEAAVSEMENSLASFKLFPQHCRTSIDQIIPLHISQVDLKENIKEIKQKELPNSVNIVPLLTTNDSLICDEIFSNDNFETFQSKIGAQEAYADIHWQTFKANTFDEQYPNDKEITWRKSIPLNVSQAKFTFDAINPIEINQTDIIESETDFLTQHASPITLKIDLQSELSLNVSETFSEYDTTKFYPETIVATESASTKFIELNPYQVKEVYASEKEEKTDLVLNMNKKQANIQISSVESVMIKKADVNECEGKLNVVRSGPLLVKADDAFNLYETAQTNIIECNDSSSKFDDFKCELKEANVTVTDQNVRSTEMIDVFQSEIAFENRKSTSITTKATTSYVPHKRCVSLQSVTHELEKDLSVEVLPICKAIYTNELPNVLEIESVQLFDSTVERTDHRIEPFSETKAIISFELKRPTGGHIVCTNEKEIDLDVNNMKAQSKSIGNIDFIENTPIQIDCVNVSESEKSFETIETILQKPSTSIDHVMGTSNTAEIMIFDSMTNLVKTAEKNEKAKLTIDELHELSVYAASPLENLSEISVNIIANQKQPISSILPHHAIEITTRTEEEMSEYLEINTIPHKHEKTPLLGDVLKSVNVTQIQTTDSVCSIDDLNTTNEQKFINMSVSEQDQLLISEIVPSEQVTNLIEKTVIFPSDANASLFIIEHNPLLMSTTSCLESFEDLKYDLTPAHKSNISFDPFHSISMHEINSEETVASEKVIKTLDNPQCIAATVFDIKNAYNQYELNLSENIDKAQIEKSPIKLISSINLVDTLMVPNTTEITVQLSAEPLIIDINKPKFQAKTLQDNLRELKTIEYMTLENSTDVTNKFSLCEMRTNVSLEEKISYCINNPNVFEKENLFPKKSSSNEYNAIRTSEQFFNIANTEENQLLISAELEDLSTRIDGTIIKPKMSGELFKGTINSKPDLYDNLGEQFITLDSDILIAMPTVSIQDELKLPLSEIVDTNERTSDIYKPHENYMKAKIRVDESIQNEQYEGTMLTDYQTPTIKAENKREREFNALKITQINALEKETNLKKSNVNTLTQNSKATDITAEYAINNTKLVIHSDIDKIYTCNEHKETIIIEHRGR